ncbi:MAG: PilW family protein [Planctomycetota bacterium]|jgi:prepilin-type N-terminal cleavage/methylation domain-containing protein
MIKRILSTVHHKGFTLAELLVALAVASIVLSAVATLAYAVSTANDITDDTSQVQAQVRFVTLRISELIRNCKLICGTPGGDLAVWRADDNGDGLLNITELIYIEAGPGKNYLRLCEFTSSVNPQISLSSIQALSTNWWFAYSSDINYTQLIQQCGNVEFSFDVSPPQTKFVNISFDLAENDVVRQYQINAYLRSWAGNLLNQLGDTLVSDDD